MINKLSKENKIDIGQIIRRFVIVQFVAKGPSNPVANDSRIRQRFTCSTTHTKLVDTIWRENKTRLHNWSFERMKLRKALSESWKLTFSLSNFWKVNLSNLLVEVLSMEVPLIPNVVCQESDYYKPPNEAWQIGDLQRSCSSIQDGTPIDPLPLDFSIDNFDAFFGCSTNYTNYIQLQKSKIIGRTQAH